MKTVWRIVLILAGILLLLGIATMAVSLFSGGGIGDLRNRVMLTNYNQSFDVETVETLQVEVLVGELTVLPGEELRVEAKNVTENGFVCTLENGCLTVREQKSASWADKLSRLLLLRRNMPEVCIYLPAELYLAQAQISLEAGTAQIEGLDADLVKLSLAVGTLQATDLTAQEADIALSAGTMELQAAVEKRCSVNVTGGTAALTLSGSAEDYSAVIDAGAGEIAFGASKYSFGRMLVGQGAKSLYLHNEVGSLRVDFAE